MTAADTSDLEPIFITVQQAEQMLALSRASVDKLLDSGVIDSRYQKRRRYVVLPSLREYAANLPTEPIQPDEVPA